MILRKPYAFLIKHFRLIHLIITGILGYLVYRNREIYLFFKKCIENSGNRFDALNYIDYGIYIYIFLALILFFVVFWLLKYKDKPRTLYIFSIVSYILIGIFMFVSFSYLSGMVNNLVDPKIIRLYRDIMFITLLFQYYFIGLMLIRGLGFDIKKFNFSKDFQEMNITDDDAEEVYVEASIDTTNIMRSIRKQKREFGYFLREFRVIIIGIILIILVILGVKGYNYYQEKYKVYNEGVTVGGYNFVTVRNSYYNIGDNGNYIIVNFDIAKRGNPEILNLGNFNLVVNDTKYQPNKNICSKFNKLGNCYKKQYVDEKVKNYILVYKVDNLNLDKTYLLYSEGYDFNYKIKLDLENY